MVHMVAQHDENYHDLTVRSADMNYSENRRLDDAKLKSGCNLTHFINTTGFPVDVKRKK